VHQVVTQDKEKVVVQDDSQLFELETQDKIVDEDGSQLFEVVTQDEVVAGDNSDPFEVAAQDKVVIGDEDQLRKPPMHEEAKSGEMGVDHPSSQEISECINPSDGDIEVSWVLQLSNRIKIKYIMMCHLFQHYAFFMFL